ncbi:MAG: DUF2723 domain-containing protein [Chloroflexi bacterium]|nr:MAG: DUF2723 domain-containing protein [Chloroflexota bacterium]
MDPNTRRGLGGQEIYTLAGSPAHPNPYKSGPVIALAMAGLAFFFYSAGLAPGLTWANYGADGGDLLAAAVTNGIPHPTGYPLYILLLQGWIELLGWLTPASDIAWRGNLFSAAAAALSVGCTVLVAQRLWRNDRTAQWAALLSGAAWMVAPLLWGQALITEVYALHAAIFVGLAWLLLCAEYRHPHLQGLSVGALCGLGLAHHLTIGLLVPGLVYWLWSDPTGRGWRLSLWLGLVVGLLPGLLLYGRMLWLTDESAPVYWGGTDAFSSFWWLVSGAAYRRYLFAVPLSMLLSRLSGWAWTLTSQWTPIGLGLALAGLYRWDHSLPRLRTLALLWALPVSIYAIGYNTADSEVYLLPLVWLMALWLPFGAQEVALWLGSRWPRLADRQPLWLAGLLVGLLLLTAARFPTFSLAQEEQARRFLQSAGAVLQPGSLVFSSGDGETFALWYGAWGSGELLDAAPETVFVNVALLQFDWYRIQLQKQYPDLPGVAEGNAAAILRGAAAQRPIFFSEMIAPALPDELIPAGLLWRYQPKQ